MIPLPPRSVAGQQRPVAVFDTECYRNYWLLKVRPIRGVTIEFEIRNGERFTPEVLAVIAEIFQVYCVISFYGNGYDIAMMRGVFAGFTTEQLKWLSDELIVRRAKPWELGLGEWEPADHIDVMEVAPGAGSLKLYAGRVHSKTIRDLPVDPAADLTPEEMEAVSVYCDIDLDDLRDVYFACLAFIEMREALGERYGMDLRSKSDAQVAEAVLRERCQIATGKRLYKQEIDWNMQFVFRVPAFITFSTPQLQRALDLVRQSTFRIGANGAVEMPFQLEGLEITIGASTYKMGIGGLHSQEKKLVAVSDANYLIRMPDVAAFYPEQIVKSGEYPPALGPTFTQEYRAIIDERLAAKKLEGSLKKAGDTSSPAYIEARVGNEGGKIMINGTFGKTGSPYSILFAPTMLIQTTIGGQLSLLMLIEWLEHYGIPVISANTDGLVLRCPRTHLALCDWLIAEWEKRTGLKMETEDYVALYARDVNNYFAIRTADDVKRKGEYASTRNEKGKGDKTDLSTKKNPDVEICSDAVADYLAKGVPLEQSIMACRDIRKFVTMQRVTGGGVKMWGDGPIKGDLVRDMTTRLEVFGWIKSGRKWSLNGLTLDARAAYEATFEPRRPEYLGKVVRWYYGTRSPGPIVTADKGYTVSLSYGAMPCMTLPDTFPDDVDFDWYITKARAILVDIGFNVLR